MTQTQAQTFESQKEKPLWNPGKMGGIEFLSSIKRLKELPELHKVIELREGFEVDHDGYHYKVGANKYGLWLSRRKLGSEQPTGKVAVEDKSPARSPMTEVADPTLVQIIAQLTDAIKLLTLAHLASSDNERSEIRSKVLAA